MLSICICVFNNWNLTRTCLNDLSKLDNTEVIIVDNGSSDQTQYNLSNNLGVLPSNFKYIRVEENLGFVRGSNLAYEHSSGQYILFINNDVKVKERFNDWTQLLIDSINNNPNDCIVGPTGGLLDENFNFVKETNKYIESKFFYMSGWCLAAKRLTFEKLREGSGENKTPGPFSTDFFSYFEDTDLSRRAKELSIELHVVDVPVFHFGRMTGKKLNLPGMYGKSRGVFMDKWSGK